MCSGERAVVNNEEVNFNAMLSTSSYHRVGGRESRVRHQRVSVPRGPNPFFGFPQPLAGGVGGVEKESTVVEAGNLRRRHCESPPRAQSRESRRRAEQPHDEHHVRPDDEHHIAIDEHHVRPDDELRHQGVGTPAASSAQGEPERQIGLYAVGPGGGAPEFFFRIEKTFEGNLANLLVGLRFLSVVSLSGAFGNVVVGGLCTEVTAGTARSRCCSNCVDEGTEVQVKDDLNSVF